jgi:hypothetical protein
VSFKHSFEVNKVHRYIILFGLDFEFQSCLLCYDISDIVLCMNLLSALHIRVDVDHVFYVWLVI